MILRSCMHPSKYFLPPLCPPMFHVEKYAYTSENRREVSDIPSSNRGSRRQISPRETGGSIDQDLRGKMREGEGDNAGGSHHGTSIFGLSYRWSLLKIRAHVDVQDLVMWVPQGRSRLYVMSMSGAVWQHCAPDQTGRETERGGSNGYREAQVAEGESKGGKTTDTTDATDATTEGGDGEERGR